jgi:Ulp1 protease family, C-terminal catalytic domain
METTGAESGTSHSNSVLAETVRKHSMNKTQTSSFEPVITDKFAIGVFKEIENTKNWLTKK